MIKITFEFPSVDAAIVFLGKQTSAAPVSVGPDKGAPPVECAKSVTSAPAAAEPPKRPRGRPFGTKKKTTPPMAEEPSAPVAAPAPVPASAPTVAPATEAAAQAALEKVFAGKGLQAAQAVLSKFGASRLRDLKPKDRAAFIVEAEKAAA